MSFLAYRTGNHDDTSGLRTTKIEFFKKYLSEGMSDPGKIIRQDHSF